MTGNIQVGLFIENYCDKFCYEVKKPLKYFYPSKDSGETPL